MVLQYGGKLAHLGATDVEVRLMAFGLQEGYNAGWTGTGVIVGRDTDEPLTAGGMMSAVMASGVVPGTAMNLKLDVAGGNLDGVNVRTWPCVVSGLSPYSLDQHTAACDVHLVDPVGFLAERPIWGAYRSVSAGEAFGGALSLATGGDGKPTLDPVLPGLPSIRIVEEFRDALNRVPYVLAVGQTLGDWLADYLAMLGLRAELRGYSDGRLQITLTDAIPRRTPLEMSLATPGGIDPPSSDTSGPIAIQGHAAFPGTPIRGGLLDDPTKGAARPLLSYGAVASVLTEAGLDVDEATSRVFHPAAGAFAEMLMLTALSRQPRFRPGETVRLSRPTHGITDWQVSSVSHWLRSGQYDNDATLIRGDGTWHPDLPLYRPPVYVSAVVDGGNDFDFHEPVPRDRLGRIKVTFPFTPTPPGEAGVEFAVADTDADRRITLADFDDDQIQTFTDDAAEWEEEKTRYDAGEYDDPYPGKEDDALTEEELENREDLLEKRTNAIRYAAFKKAASLDAADRDQDGVLSLRDTLVSDELSEVLRDDASRQELLDQIADEDGEFEEGSLAEEYARLFGEDEEGLSEETLAVRADAADAADRWPPRIPLPVVMPMAGALHGFITAHRHGDSCRVAVHNPFSAEILGFQYRDDRKINADLSGSVGGLVVEHNYAQAWSGLVFRKADDMETATSDGTSDEESDDDTSDEG